MRLDAVSVGPTGSIWCVFMALRIWVAGHRGMVGSAIVRQLQHRNVEILTVDREALDLRDQVGVRNWLKANRPDTVILAAAKVGGILANDSYPADFIHDNLTIQQNVIHGSHTADINDLVFLGSSCIYPKFAQQPMAESSLLTGTLEPTNEWYAIAKIAGIKMCQAYTKQYGRQYISLMPCNLYGPNDNFDLNSSHVIPALMRKMHEAKSKNAQTVEIWGTGMPLREFMHVDDLAAAVVFCMDNVRSYEHINCGAGSDVSIRELAETMQRVVGFEGQLRFDRTKPDGTPKKLMDSSRLRQLGWRPTISFEDGLASTYAWFLNNIK